MAPSISFFAGQDDQIQDLAGSGLGFFGGAGFGASVAVNDWQGRTFITNGAGSAQGPECDNTRYVSPTGAVLNGAASTAGAIKLSQLPNERATLNLRFTNDFAVRTQNVHLRIYDRTNPSNPASGVTTAVYEIVHSNPTQTNDGSGGPGLITSGGAHAWNIFTPVSTGYLNLTASPGTSGLRPSGSSTMDTRHDWYVALSASPDSIGSKVLYGLWIELEYL